MSKAIKVPVDIRRVPCKIATGEAHPPLSNQNQSFNKSKNRNIGPKNTTYHYCNILIYSN
ncbi:hypothetical protein RIR_e36095_A0A2N1NFG3_9GLOM [Rhizophagus irregularis DAOM 181602=DAOM 197198]|nr:hypothetical protein RIR_e36095_A0A2N1NFG3_9GLOM [Rhizophagus irregularis DAOM 181602=DAOM 197198]